MSSTEILRSPRSACMTSWHIWTHSGRERSGYEWLLAQPEPE